MMMGSPPRTLNGSGSQRVLIVDDNHDAALIFKRGFEILTNYEVETAVGSRQALQQCQKQPFDLLIVDYRLPEMDGLTLAMWVQQLFPKTAVILMSGLGNIPADRFHDNLSIHTILSKPIAFTDLCQVAKEAIQGGRTGPALC